MSFLTAGRQAGVGFIKKKRRDTTCRTVWITLQYRSMLDFTVFRMLGNFVLEEPLLFLIILVTLLFDPLAVLESLFSGVDVCVFICGHVNVSSAVKSDGL